MLNKDRKALALAIVFALSGALIVGCSGKEERQQKYLHRAQEYYSKGNYDKARVEAKNVLQINANNAEAHYIFAEIAEQESNWQLMYGELNAALENDSKLLKARVKLAQLLVISNQLDKAHQQAIKIKEQDPNSPDYYLIAAAIAARQKKTDEAIENARKALAIQPGHIGATEVLTSIYLESDPEKAAQVIAEGIRISPNDEDLHLLQIQVFSKLNKVEDAIAGLKELIKRHPDKINYVYHLVQYYVAQSRLADAESLIRQTVKDHPDNADLKLEFINFLAQHHKPEDGLTQLLQYVNAEPNSYKLRSGLARFYMATNAPDKAIATYQYTIDKDVKAEGIDARNRVVEILLGENKRTEAETILKDVFKLEPENADALLIRARLELADNNTEGAIADLRSVLKNSPDSPQALLLLAAAQERTGTASLALDSYRKILQTNGNNVAALIGAARLSLAINKLEDAKQLLEHARTLADSNADISKLLIELHVRNREWQSAIDLCDQMIRDDKNASLGYYLKGRVLLEKKDAAGAIEALRKSLDKEPRAIEALQSLISAYAVTKQADAATAFLEAHVKSNPGQVYAQELLGSLYRETGKLQQAQTVLSDVIKRQPSRVSAYRELLAVYSMQKQPDQMASLLESGLQHNPKSVELMVMQAQRYESIEQYGKALELYEKALALQPKADVIKNNLAVLLIDRFPTDENLRRAQSLTADFADSKNPILIDTVAWLQYKLKNYPQAISLLESVLTKNIEAPELRYHLGMAYSKNGEPGKAKGELTKATSTKAQYPGRTEAEAELRKL